MHFGGEVRAEAGRWHAGRGGQAGRRRGEPAMRGATGWLGEVRRAGDARCGGALARIRVWGLGAARLLYELALRGFAWVKTSPIFGILLLSGRHFL